MGIIAVAHHIVATFCDECTLHGQRRLPVGVAYEPTVEIERFGANAMTECIANDLRQDLVVRNAGYVASIDTRRRWRRIKRRERVAMSDEWGHFGGMRMPPSTRIDSAFM